MHATKTASRRFFTPKRQKYLESHADLLLLIGCIAILLIVPLLRPEGSFLAGEESYHLFRLADNPSTFDPLSYGGRFAAYAWGTPLLLAPSPDILSRTLPPLMGLLSFLLMWGILKKLKLEDNTRRIALAVLMISPPFMYAFTTLNSQFIALFLSLLGFYAFLHKRHMAAAVPFIVMPIFNLPLTIISMILLCTLTFFSKRRDSFWLIFVCTAIIATAYYLTISKYAGSPEKILFPIQEIGITSKLQNYISDLGGKFGISVFGAMLAVLGILYSWKRKYSDLGVFFSILAISVMLFFSTQAIHFANIFAAILSAKALSTLLKKGWESQTLKNFTILVLVLGLVFSSLSFIERGIDSEPNVQMVYALETLKAEPDGVAFSHYSRGYWLEYAGKKTVMDESFAFAPSLNERWEDSQKLFQTRSVEEASGIIDKYSIKYIWIDKGLADNLWDNDEDGLQFLLQYSDKFKKLYISDEVRVWGVVR